MYVQQAVASFDKPRPRASASDPRLSTLRDRGAACYDVTGVQPVMLFQLSAGAKHHIRLNVPTKSDTLKINH